MERRPIKNSGKTSKAFSPPAFVSETLVAADADGWKINGEIINELSFAHKFYAG